MDIVAELEKIKCLIPYNTPKAMLTDVQRYLLRERIQNLEECRGDGHPAIDLAIRTAKTQLESL